MAVSTSSNPVIPLVPSSDPFVGVLAVDHRTTTAQQSTGSTLPAIIVPHDDPFYPLLENDGQLLMAKMDEAENLISEANAKVLAAEAAAASEAAARKEAEAAAEAMRQSMAGMSQAIPYTPAQGLLPGAMGVSPFPGFKPLPWAQSLIDVLSKAWGRTVVGLCGQAGVGKTFTVEQWCHQQGIALFFVKGQGQDPWRMMEYQEAKSGETHYRLGALAEALQTAAANATVRCLVLIDEVCTTPGEFQLKLAELFEFSGSRKLQTTEHGVIAVPANVQFVWTANATGFNPQSRHRGTIAPPVLNRSLCVQVPPLTEADIVGVLGTKCPTTKPADQKRVAITITRLAAAVAAGQLDLEATIRTAIQVCELQALGLDWAHAWGMAYTNKIDEPAQQASALGVIKEQF